MKIFAIDFDGTLVTDKFPEIGEDIQVVQNFVKYRKLHGDKFVLWTCRTGKYLEHAVEYCKSKGIEFDAINDNLPEIVDEYGDNPRKIFADYYIDDRNSVIMNDLGQVLSPLRLLGEV